MATVERDKMSFISGATLTRVKVAGSRTIHWKQGSLGFGMPMEETYQVCDYRFEHSGGSRLVPVFVHVQLKPPAETLKVDSKLQFGVINGVLFFVLHDRSKFKPYQHRFMRPGLDESKYVCQRYVEDHFGTSLTWAVDDHLRDFQFRQNFD